MAWKVQPLNGKYFVIEGDAGHGAGSAHNRGFVGGNEGDYNWLYMQRFKKRMLEYKDVVFRETRPNIKDNPSLEARGRAGKGADLLYSAHTNATGTKNKASGTEIYDDVNPRNSNRTLATVLGKAIANAQGIRFRGVFYRKLNNGSNYYAVLRYSLAKNAFLVEHCFHDNPSEIKYYKNNLDKIATAAAEAIADYWGLERKDGSNLSGTTENKEDTINDIPIMGDAELNVSELLAFFNSFKVTPKIAVPIEKFIEMYLNEGEVEGVRGDVAFIQAIHETGKFQFGGDVIPEQNNFAGIGTVGGGVKGHYFDSPQDGIRAQIQHLKAYASGDPLRNRNIDPRFNLVARGSAKTVRGLTGKWATDKAYGDKLMDYYNQAMEFKGEDELKYNISIIDKRDGEAALEVLFAGEEGSVISKGGNYKYGNDSDTEVIGIGKDRTSHTSYLDYFISGDTAADTLLKAKDFIAGNKEKYKAPKKGK